MIQEKNINHQIKQGVAGVYNRKNHCFLNAILQSLTYTVLEKADKPKNKFCTYLLDTLKYINDSSSPIFIDLFWKTLSDLRPEMFSRVIEEQSCQDASETLMWLINESQILDLFQVLYKDGVIDFPVQLQYPEPFTFVILIANGLKQKVYLPHNLNLKMMLFFLDIPDYGNVVIFLSGYKEFDMIYDPSSDLDKLFQLGRERDQYLYIQTMAKAKDDLIIWIRGMYQENTVMRPFCYIQPFKVCISDSVLDVYGKIADYFSVHPSQIELKLEGLVLSQDDLTLVDQYKISQFIDVLINDWDKARLDLFNQFQCTIWKNLDQIISLEGILKEQNFEERVISFPEILVFQIDRTVVNMQGEIKKRQKSIKIPETLSFKNDYVFLMYETFIKVIGQIQTYQYDGHYTSFCQINGIWHCLDNEHSYTITNLHTKEVQLVFYLKIDSM